MFEVSYRLKPEDEWIFMASYKRHKDAVKECNDLQALHVIEFKILDKNKKNKKEK